MEGTTFENPSEAKTARALAAVELQAQEIKGRAPLPVSSLESLSRILLERQIGSLRLLAIACGESSAEQLQ